jgi:hypothetical protein
MFIAIVGTPSSGKRSVLRYLVEKHGFIQLGLEKPSDEMAGAELVSVEAVWVMFGLHHETGDLERRGGARRASSASRGRQTGDCAETGVVIKPARCAEFGQSRLIFQLYSSYGEYHTLSPAPCKSNQLC